MQALLPHRRVVFLDTGTHAPEADNVALNPGEAAAVVALANAHCSAGLAPACLGVITPHRSQVLALALGVQCVRCLQHADLLPYLDLLPAPEPASACMHQLLLCQQLAQVGPSSVESASIDCSQGCNQDTLVPSTAES